MTYYRAPQNNGPLPASLPKSVSGEIAGATSGATSAQPVEKFDYFPAFIKVANQKVVVLGGGEVAAGKLRLLIRSHADITVIAPELCDDIAKMHRAGQITWHSGPFVDTLINRAVLVFDASDNPCLTQRVRKATKRRNILLNVVDKTAECDFIVPAILDRAPVMITISTGACAPALARILRQRLETVFPAGISNIARIARDARQTVARHLSDGLSRQRFWTRFFQKSLRAVRPEKLGRKDIDQALQTFIPNGSHPTVASGQIHYALVSATNAYDIPHGLARNIETADIIFHDPQIAPDILALARRDATLVAIDDLATDPQRDRDQHQALQKQSRFFTRQGLDVVWLSSHT
jgi:uroporphyrin-III C-methyltransferase/precorrin-2 dehydrogenase/sirohydrochlorin ferrochelatase